MLGWYILLWKYLIGFTLKIIFVNFFLKEGKIIKKSSGFSGKGFKFDETEQALANERKKLQKAALGLQDSDDEDAAVDVSIAASVCVPWGSLWALRSRQGSLLKFPACLFIGGRFLYIIVNYSKLDVVICDYISCSEDCGRSSDPRVQGQPGQHSRLSHITADDLCWDIVL